MCFGELHILRFSFNTKNYVQKFLKFLPKITFKFFRYFIPTSQSYVDKNSHEKEPNE